MIDFKKLAETAEFHIKRGDNMSMDPMVIKTLALMVAATKETLEQNLHLADGNNCTLKSLRDAYLKINPTWNHEEDGKKVRLTTHMEGREDDEFPECKWCGGTGLEVQGGMRHERAPDFIQR